MVIKHNDPDTTLVKEVPIPLTTGGWDRYLGRALHIVFMFIYRKRLF